MRASAAARMPRFAANLSFLFTEWPFLDRFAAAADAGFEAVEYLFPYEWPAEVLAERLQRNGLTQALFNVSSGDWAAGDRGLAALPARESERRAAVRLATEYAEALGCRRVHLMAGVGSRDDANAVAAYRESVRESASTLAERGIDLLIEPINRRDVPGYFLDDFGFARRLIEALALPNLKLQFDIYHRQILHGDVATALRELMPIVGHVQIASVPGRHEPDTEELNFAHLLAELDRLGYQGWVGCEYRPRAGTLEGLAWFRPHASRARRD